MEEKIKSTTMVCKGDMCNHDCDNCGSCANVNGSNPVMWSQNCGMHCGTGYMGGHRHYFLRWLVGLLILGVVFSMGVMFGEIKGYLRADPSFGGGNEHFMFRTFDRTMPMMQYYSPSSSPLPQ